MNNQHQPHSASNKVTIKHLERLAYVYVRQSSPKQVERNRESQIYQYQLSHRAQEMGWGADRVRVIDADLGLSGQGSQYRDGFQELVTEVSLGHVGIIFGYEVSRLARNNRDWYHLLDLASVFGTLIADADGVYDPRQYNDRLLLGLKGTMSEAELHLLKMRLEAGRMSQVKRGAYQQPLPTGLVRLPDGTVVKDPDQQVQRIIDLIFTKFSEFGSCRQVLHYLKREEILLPRRHCAGRHAGDLLWKVPTDSTLLSILHNPAYAGAFAYGRRQIDPALRQPQHPGVGRTHRVMDEWLHLQHDVYPGYILWKQFLANQEKLRENSTYLIRRKENRRGPAREGSALLQGLAVCGLCGARMAVCYKRSHRYHCDNLERRVLGGTCASLHGASLDEAVVEAFFEALRPARLDALEGVLNQQSAERARAEKHWQDQLRRAEYEARLAQRQYDAVDPDNRLVAVELERRWEEKLQTLREIQEQHARHQQRTPVPALTAEQRAQFQNLSENLPALWNSGAISATQQKELLRALISGVIVKRLAPDQVEARIVWASRHYTILLTRPPVLCDRDVSGYEAMVERIHELWQSGITGDTELAAKLSAEGYHSARSEGVSSKSVMKIRLKNRWYSAYHQSRNAETVGEHLTVSGLAAKLGVSPGRIYRYLSAGLIEPGYLIRRSHGQGWLIKNDPALLATLQKQMSANLKT
ncbi:MAG: recombinase family protein [Acidobacteriota bacterium]